ncbi:hypothetical protein Sjap_024977 [Stephania japonica]|uniref:DUF7894 domain-containing protein n=1 Tax=Stephania japonica TaxID=461633 RepID=A0AAP0E0Y7_9MAGN
MKVGPKLIFLFKDPNGVGPAIFAALQPNTNNLQPKQTSAPFELSLDKYGIRDFRASGDLLHFIDYQVLLMENYEPPVVSCAINQVLQSIIEENSSSSMMPTLVLPFLVQASTFHNWDKNDSAAVQQLAYSLRTLGLLDPLPRVLKFPTVLLIGPMHPPQRGDEYLEDAHTESFAGLEDQLQPINCSSNGFRSVF